jgi:hypothetical protein
MNQNDPLLLVNNKNKVRCNSKNKNKLNFTCLTNNIILQLVKIFNTTFCSHNQEFCLENKIIKTQNRNIKEIYKELKQKLSKFNKLYSNEIYWKKIKEFSHIFINNKYLFVPKMPTEWCHSISKWRNATVDAPWLSNYDIDEIIQEYENKYNTFKFLGSTPIDFRKKKYGTCTLNLFNNSNSDNSWLIYNKQSNIKYCNFNSSIYSDKKYFGIVFNTDTFEGAGKHWMAMYFCIDKSKPCILFFDSAVTFNPYHNEIKGFIKNIQDTYPSLNFNIKYNNKQHQTSNSECGMYSIYFILTMIDAELHPNKSYSANYFFDTYFNNKNYTIYDNLMILYRTKLFDPSICKKIELETL